MLRLFKTLLLLAFLYGALMALIAWDGARDQRGPADIILVLGSGGVNVDGTPTLRERARLDKALEIAAEQPRAFLLASGAAEIHGQSEAAMMASYLASHGIALSRIVPDPAGATTWDSAHNAASFLHDRCLTGGGVIVVTEYFHVPRARLALKRFGIQPIYSAPAFQCSWGDIRSLAREVGGMIYYRFRFLS